MLEELLLRLLRGSQGIMLQQELDWKDSLIGKDRVMVKAQVDFLQVLPALDLDKIGPKAREIKMAKELFRIDAGDEAFACARTELLLMLRTNHQLVRQRFSEPSEP